MAILLFAASAPLAAQSDHILLLEDNPEDRIFEIDTRVRHTTVITLPAGENVLDYVVGDAEYWHLSGAANVAFLKPVAEDVATNVALVCESGRIYAFLVAERGDAAPHLIVRFEGNAESEAAEISAAGGRHEPAFVARARVAPYQAMAQQAAEDAQAARDEAAAEIAKAQTEAGERIDAFRADYPTRIQFPYRLDKKAGKWPFLVTAMWNDGQFTYLRSNAQESPALYERKDGKPSLVPYDLTEDGLYIVRRLIGDGWLQIGKQRAAWTFDQPEPLP